MTFNYTASLNTASRLIANFGQAATLKRRSVSGGNVWDASTGTPTTTDYAVTLVVVPQKKKEPNGSLTVVNEVTIYLDALGLTITPAVSDCLYIGTQTYEIKEVEPLSPAGTVVLYIVKAAI